MIPDLLWRCPLCATNDALVHRTRSLLPDKVDCLHCQASWQVRRVAGNNFFLKLISQQPNDERSITAWYAEIKKTLRLEKISDPQVMLAPSERLFLASKPAELWEAASAHSAIEGLENWCDTGRIFLSDQRFLWQGDSRQEEFPLDTVFGVRTMLTLGIAIHSGTRLVFIHLRQESPLKWLTYLAMLAPQIEARTGHRITVSHY